MSKQFMCLFVFIICLSGLSVEATTWCYYGNTNCRSTGYFKSSIAGCCSGSGLRSYYNDNNECIPCDTIDCYSQTTKCDTENPIQLPFYSADSSSRAAAGDRCCSLSNRGSWNDKITDTCTSCENTGPGDCFSGYDDCTGAYNAQNNVDECCGSNSLSYQDDYMCIPCDSVVCYPHSTTCQISFVSVQRTIIPHSSTPESIAQAGDQCCATEGGSWYDARNPDTCTPCDVGPNHCFYTNSDCSGGFSAAAKRDNCCFSMGFDGLSYKDADNLCIPCDSIVCYSQTDQCDGGEKRTILHSYYSERILQAAEQCCANGVGSWYNPEQPSICTPCRQVPTCHYDTSCSDDNSVGASSTIGECCGDGSHGSFKENDECISCESIMCYSSSTNCDSADDITIRQTSDECCTEGGASWSNLRDGSCRQCTQEIFGDPHFFIPLLSKKVLCYSIQGYPGLVFNLIYNKHFVINALFIDSAGDTTKATWIGKLAVIPQENNKTESVLFDSVNQTVTITSYGSLKASMIEKINFTDTGSVIFIPHVGRQVGEHPTVHVIYSKPKASFDVTFFNDHLNVNWNLQDKELSESHGLMGQFMKAGVDIDEKKKILVYSDYHDPVPVIKDSVMTGDPNKLCWRAMNNGKQGEGLIHGSILDYVVTNLLDTDIKFKNI